MAKVEIRIGFAGQRRCGSHYTLGFLAGGKYSSWLTRFSVGFSVFADGDGHEACHDDTLASFR